MNTWGKPAISGKQARIKMEGIFPKYWNFMKGGSEEIFFQISRKTLDFLALKW